MKERALPGGSGWIPSGVVWHDDGPEIHWTMLGERRLTEPFFDQTLGGRLQHPFFQLFRVETTAEEMVEWAAAAQTLPLRGMIFHESRCGSTLMAQMLAACEDNVVVSEPASLDKMLEALHYVPGLPRTTHVEWVRALVSALGQPRAGGERAFYLKLDCCHIHHAALLREAFPGVPCVFLYRNPVEVMVSHARMANVFTVFNTRHDQTQALVREDWTPESNDSYRAMALERICAAGLAAAQLEIAGAMLVNYSELPEAMFGRVFTHFKLESRQIPVMLAAAHREAHYPDRIFERDSAGKHAEASECLREAAAKHLQPIYERLEAERLRQIALRRLAEAGLALEQCPG